ncbi:MAG TPA: 4-hydroxyphenylacetate 3-hydroxylase N-terminal domain-containing protein [Thermodesulfobacteriota bacterium]|nr:4-hydroxyphenylacetate 3-hydroxylase N-terminal domain-containing protein [Thermodesulfobacteriota bacterium]
MKTSEQYLASLRRLKPTAYMFGEKIENVVDNPRIRAGINATGATYELANHEKYKDLITTLSPLTGEHINRFTLPPQSTEDLVMRVKINRILGGYVGTCHQRCTGLDCLCTLSIVAYDIDKKYGTHYYDRFKEFLKSMQKNDLTGNASVTDVKGDRNLSPREQPDKDMYLRVVDQTKEGIIVRGAKVHQTGSLSAHEIIVLPTRAMQKGDEDYALAFAIPSDTEGLIHVVGRNSMDTREIEGVDCGNIRYSKYCPTLIFDEVLVPWDRVFMFREVEFTGEMVSRFSAFHRQSHGGCKSGKIDVMTGAALLMMEYNGTTKVSQHREKVINMIHMAETLYGCSLAASYEGKKEPSGTYFIDPILANASKIHEGKEMAEVTRLLIDVTGGFVADLPSDRDFENPEIGELLKKYLKGATEVPVEKRIKMLRLIEKMAMESADTISDIHGGGSPAAHRVTIFRESDIDYKKRCAKRLAGIEP